MKKLFLAAAMLIAGGTIAVAADPAVYVPVDVPPAVPAAHDWSGWYLGVYAGALGGRFTGDITEPGLSGLDAGAQLTYNSVQPGNWVVSPFVAFTLPVQTAEVLDFLPVKVQWAAQGGLRLGYAQDRWLPYVYAAGIIGSAHAGDFIDESRTHTGYMLGVGVDYAVDSKWTIGARYAFYSLGAKTYDCCWNVGWQGHSILATLNFKLH